MHAIAHGSCTDPVRESALKVDSGRKIPCRTRDSNQRQYCAWLLQPAALPTVAVAITLTPRHLSFFLSFLFCPLGGRPGSVHQQEQPCEGFEPRAPAHSAAAQPSVGPTTGQPRTTTAGGSPAQQPPPHPTPSALSPHGSLPSTEGGLGRGWVWNAGSPPPSAQGASRHRPAARLSRGAESQYPGRPAPEPPQRAAERRRAEGGSARASGAEPPKSQPLTEAEPPGRQPKHGRWVVEARRSVRPT